MNHSRWFRNQKRKLISAEIWERAMEWANTSPELLRVWSHVLFSPLISPLTTPGGRPGDDSHEVRPF